MFDPELNRTRPVNALRTTGFNDQEIVALSGAHTLGRAFKERSGTVQYGASVLCVLLRGSCCLCGAPWVFPSCPASLFATLVTALLAQASRLTPCISNACAFPGYGAQNGTAYTNGSTAVRPDGRMQVGMAGGQSWTKNWLTFDNSYFSAKPTADALLLRLPTDAALYEARSASRYLPPSQHLGRATHTNAASADCVFRIPH